jgi:hypothetical protein
MGKTAPSTTSTQNSQMSAGQQGQWSNQLANVNSTIAGDIGSVNYGNTQSQLGQQSQNILGNQVNAQGLAAPISAAGQNSWTTPGTAQSFMSPYESTALQNQVGLATSTELNPQLAQMQRSDAASGALGGSRGAINQGLATQGFNQNMNSMISQGENQAYNTGQQQFNAQNALNLQAQQAGAQTQLAGANSNVYANLAASQPLMQQIQASEAPGQQVMQETSALAMQPKEGTNTTTQVTSPGSGGIMGDIIGGLGGAAQLGLGIATGGASGALSSLQNMNTPGKAAGGLVGAGKRPSANPAFDSSLGLKKGGIVAGGSKKSKKGSK